MDLDNAGFNLYNKKQYMTSQIRFDNRFSHLEGSVIAVGDDGGLMDEDLVLCRGIVRCRCNEAKALFVRKPFHSALILHIQTINTLPRDDPPEPSC